MSVRYSVPIIALAAAVVYTAEPGPTQMSRNCLVGPCWVHESEINGRRATYSLCREALSATPDWAHASLAEPPLAMRQAVTISSAELKRYFPRVKKWDLVGIGLELSPVKDKWYYTVTWQPHDWRTQDEHDKVEIAVLMNGRAVDLEWDDDDAPAK